MWEEATRKSTLRLWTSTIMCGTLWQASTRTFAPTSCAQCAISLIGREEATEREYKYKRTLTFKLTINIKMSGEYYHCGKEEVKIENTWKGLGGYCEIIHIWYMHLVPMPLRS